MQPGNFQVTVLLVYGLAIPCAQCVSYRGVRLLSLEAGETNITLRWTDLQAANAVDPTLIIGNITIDFNYGSCSHLGNTPGSCDGYRIISAKLTQSEAIKARYTIENLENGTWYSVCFKATHQYLTIGIDCTMLEVGVTKGPIQSQSTQHLYPRDTFLIGAKSVLVNYTVSNEIFTLQNLDIFLKDAWTEKRIDGNVTVRNTGTERIFLANFSGLQFNTKYWLCTAPHIVIQTTFDDVYDRAENTNCFTFTTASSLKAWEKTYNDSNDSNDGYNNSGEHLAIASSKTKLYILASALGMSVVVSRI